MRRFGLWEESRAYTDEAISLNSRDGFLRWQAALVRHSTRDFAAALRSYDEALNIQPDDSALIAGRISVSVFMETGSPFVRLLFSFSSLISFFAANSPLSSLACSDAHYNDTGKCPPR